MNTSTQDQMHQVNSTIKEKRSPCMKIFSTRTFLAFAAALLLVGCAARQPAQPLPDFTLTPFDSGQYVSSVDNFLIVLDASSSMGDQYNGNEKFAIARELVKRINKTLPELGQNAGLRSFGHSDAVSRKLTVLFYGLEKYSTSALNGKLDLISEPGGTSPMHAALTASSLEELKGISGKTAVLIISDGQEEFSLESPITLKAAQALKDQVGGELCYYPIFIGDNQKGHVLMEDMARIGKCGFVSNADALLTNDGMARFVKDVFLSPKTMAAAPKDTDNDGVTDDRDKCPGTPAGTAVDAYGCPLVTEKKTSMTDMKPAPVPAGATLNAQGVWVIDAVLFDFDKSVIKPEHFGSLDTVADILKANPGLSAKLHGHTDNVGTQVYNDALSLRRAQSVKNYLVGRGIDGNRLSCKGFGFSKPAASNKTDNGRALNRRVELYPVK
ncbi:MAG: OmpA family protein [Pseudomonadota bacterium]